VIIACPECTKPFEVEDSEIAPLVQIECPHCVFRMILDFEAANDASLIETTTGSAPSRNSTPPTPLWLAGMLAPAPI